MLFAEIFFFLLFDFSLFFEVLFVGDEVDGGVGAGFVFELFDSFLKRIKAFSVTDTINDERGIGISKMQWNNGLKFFSASYYIRINKNDNVKCENLCPIFLLLDLCFCCRLFIAWKTLVLLWASPFREILH